MGIYSQNFVLVDSATSEECNCSSGAVLTIEATSLEARRPTPDPRKRVKFEVSEQQINIPATPVGRVGQVNIRIENPSSVPIRLRCRCEVVGGGRATAGVLSVSAPTLTVKAKGTITLPLAFRPKTPGEIKGVVTIEAMVGKTHVKVEVTAEGVGGSYPVPKAAASVRMRSRAASVPTLSTSARVETPTCTPTSTRTQTPMRTRTLAHSPARARSNTLKPTPISRKSVATTPLKTSTLVPTIVDRACDSPVEMTQPSVAESIASAR
jgi:hypothetical protein